MTDSKAFKLTSLVKRSWIGGGDVWERAKLLHMCLTLCNPMDRILLAEDWSGVPFPPPGGLRHPGINPESLASAVLAGGFFTTSTAWEACGFPRFLSLDRSVLYQTLYHEALTCSGQTEVVRGLLGGLLGRQRKED